jgi:hypothetical protein
MSHLQRSEGAEEVSLPIDFFRDLLYQAMPRTWVGLTDEDCDEVERWVEFKEEGSGRIPIQKLIRYIDAKLKEKNNG